jgi:hypothetical protein
LVFNWWNAQRATARTPKMATPRVNRIETMCGNGMLLRPSSKTALTPPVKADIQVVTQAGTTTSPSAPMPSPAISEAVITCVSG